METIWDYNPTDKELTQAFGSPVAAPNAGDSVDTQLAALALLFADRGDDQKANQYISQIKDPDYQFSTILSLQRLA